MSPFRLLAAPGRRAIALLALAMSPGFFAAHAAEPVPVLDRGTLSLGLFDTSNELSGRWDSRRGSFGTPFSFQRDLGFDRSLRTPFWNAGLALGRDRQFRLDGFHYSSDDDSSLVLDRSIEIDGARYEAGARFEGSLDTSTQGVSLTWFFRRTPHSATGVGLGALKYDIHSNLAAWVNVEDSQASLRKTIDEQAWVPLLRGEYVRVLGDRWRMGLAASYVEADLDNVSGHVIDAHARFEYFPWRNVGVSLRYSYNRVDLDFSRTSYDGTIDLHSRGPQLLAAFRF